MTNNTSSFKHLFGPVPSRRFHRSLGIDLNPPKTCSLDCIFCQLGPTTNLTSQIDEYVPVAEVIGELKQWLYRGEQADYLTFAGSGEPTLHSGIETVIGFLRHHSSIPIAVLTNGTLLFDETVRRRISGADVIKVTCSAWDESSFIRLHRPCAGVTFDRLVQGVMSLRDEFRGQLWLEVLIIDGINSDSDSIQRLAAQTREFAADRIHLNTCVRPPSEPSLRACSPAFLQSLLPHFGPKAEVIAEYSSNVTPTQTVHEQTIVDLLKRRPCTAEQLAGSLGLHPNELSKHLGSLVASHRIKLSSEASGSYFIINSQECL